jgi:CheY-like chemotaxis protein
LINKRIIETHFSFKTIAFTDPLQALEQLKQWLVNATFLPEIIFLDIEMPDMNGWEFLDELHALPDTLIEKCYIIILTSSIDVDDIEKSKTYSVVRDFISKPLTTDKLKEIVWSR